MPSTTSPQQAASPRPAAPARRTTSPHRAAFAAATVSALLLAGCASSGNAAPGTDGAAATGEPQSGGTLRFGLGYDPTCLDPQQAGGNDSLNVGRQLVDSLTDQDPETGEIVPWIATSWEVSPDATTFTFTLRDDATFADGTPVDAAAVQANLDGIAELGAQSTLGSSYLDGYVQTVVVDPQTARVEFSQPSAQFLQATSTMTLGLFSVASTTLSVEDRCAGEFVGSGPFTLTDWQPARSASLERREGYAWPSSIAGHEGEAYLDGIEYSVVSEPSVRTGSLQSGQLDAFMNVLPTDEEPLKASGQTVSARTNPGISFSLVPNTDRPVGGDEEVRLAISAAINRQEVVDTVLTPSYKPATSPLSSSNPGYTDLGDLLAFDLDAATERLDAEGWEPGDDGIRTKDGQRLQADVVYLTNFAASEQILQLVQQQLVKAGIDLQLRQVTMAEYPEVQKVGDYDFSWNSLTRADGDVLRTIYGSSGRNVARLAEDDPVNTPLDAQAAEGDDAARLALLADAQTQLLERGLSIPVMEFTTVIATAPTVHDLKFEASSRLSFYDTWIEAP
ncbi:ABC-type dipeptide transport system, periplasmic component [Sanguibacter keddieii DSM 10542]|uniref:ABC-type dipeptide transport system, periplasmic component n=1 Tax=Sanguibacter keddieii (strain ATCC 51767 / DSM 10542 / NCFB 3025 / ST-74) TaxID=446469 RepID=D1BEN8_SANKS|nr:ABC transporter substrate-binding protein [Sanguibacter keddieii]ACZ23324.1 ABC-type dipeptide transport system, periplasmic component [Sanguibacter keddieii DSM 10542]